MFRFIYALIFFGVAAIFSFLWLEYKEWCGTPYSDNSIKITFNYYCPEPTPEFKKTAGIPYQEISCRIVQYTYESDGVIPADYYNLKIFGKNNSKLTSLGLNSKSNKLSDIKPELILKKILLPLENYEISNFKIIENKIIKINVIDVYYLKAKLNRKEKGEFITEAIIFYNPENSQFYVASTYYEETDSRAFEKDPARFLNSFQKLDSM